MTSAKACPRGSPPPLVSMTDSKRDSLVGLQRLVYNAKTFTQDKEIEEDINQNNGKSIRKVHNVQKQTLLFVNKIIVFKAAL